MNIWNKTPLKATKLMKSSELQIIVCCECERKYHVLALFFSLGISLCPLLGQNTGAALWSESAQLFINFCKTRKSLQSIVFPNRGYGCFQAKHTGSLKLLSTHIDVRTTFLTQITDTSLQQSPVKKSSQMYLHVHMSACINVRMFICI